MKNLREWFEDYNVRNPLNKCPDDILSPFCSKESLNKWLCVYITETRNQKGEPYPPRSIYALLCGILHEMRMQNPNYVNFFNKEDPGFRTFHVTLDNLFKQLRSKGIGSSSARTEGILWESAVLNIDNPKGLL